MADEDPQVPLEEASAPEEDTTPTSGRTKAAKKEAPALPTQDPHMLDAVHYVYNGMHVASTIYEVFEDGTVRLQATDGSLSASPVAQDAGGADGTFHYPEE